MPAFWVVMHRIQNGQDCYGVRVGTAAACDLPTFREVLGQYEQAKKKNVEMEQALQLVTESNNRWMTMDILRLNEPRKPQADGDAKTEEKKEDVEKKEDATVLSAAAEDKKEDSSTAAAAAEDKKEDSSTAAADLGAEEKKDDVAKKEDATVLSAAAEEKKDDEDATASLAVATDDSAGAKDESKTAASLAVATDDTAGPKDESQKDFVSPFKASVDEETVQDGQGHSARDEA